MSYVSVTDYTVPEYFELFNQIAEIKHALHVDKVAFHNVCADISATLMFWEPSTRTSGSFEKAFKFLGVRMLYDFNVTTSSVAKGETIEDTARMVATGGDIIVVRHSNAGTCTNLTNKILDIPVINAGEGTGEHPTQALLDLYTIWEKFGHTDVKIGLYGDLNHGRTAHSLIKLGAIMGANFVCIEPRDELKMPQEYIDYARSHGSNVEIVKEAEEVISEIDVLYTTRLQKERGAAQDKIERQDSGSGYGVTPKLLENFKETGILLHPLPRVDELDSACDADPRAWYFKQAENGIYARMALIAKELDRNLNL